MSDEGRSCPLDYRTAPGDFREAPHLTARTVYVVGGLYGNPEALETLLEMKAAEERRGESVTLIFNGDFNCWNVDPATFRLINETVLEHTAIRGNAEAELARPGEYVGCGCNYPSYIDPSVTEQSNKIIESLNRTAVGFPEIQTRLSALANHITIEVGGQRIAILHGDPESLSGWGFAAEALAHLERDQAHAGEGVPEGMETSEQRVAGFFRESDVAAFACTHTGLAFARDFQVEGRGRLVINNGSAGMPNFRGDLRGLLTRISADARPPADSLYGITLERVRYDAIPIPYDTQAWLRRIRSNWPQGTSGFDSYNDRITRGPAYTLAQAIRGSVTDARAWK